MSNVELIQQIFNLCIVPLLGALTVYITSLIKKKSAEIEASTENELTKKYVALLSETITNCVLATNQTYVENLKAEKVFDKEAQKKALEMTGNAVMAVLTEDAKEYLSYIYDDLEQYIIYKIEAEINKK